MPRPSALNTLVGRMTVGELARHLGLGVAQLVEAALGSGPPATAPVTPRPRSKGEATRKQLHHAVDRWLIAEVLEQEGGNVTRAARRLGVARTQLRKRRARVQALAPDQMERRFARIDSAANPPTRDELRTLGTMAAVHEAVDHWLTNAAFEKAPGNVSEAARRMGISRRVARELRDRFCAD
ncbi:MAG: helix-turn-helix domain-containing protein [Nannocystaceae bacterium]